MLPLHGVLLTPVAGRFYSDSVSTETDNVHFELELVQLDKRLDELLVICRKLQDENVSLKQRQDTLIEERARLIQLNDQVRSRVEAMIGRLRAMEQPT